MCRQTLARLVMVGALIHAVAFSAGAVSLQDMKGFEPLFFGVPMAWDGTLVQPRAANLDQPTTTNEKVGT